MIMIESLLAGAVAPLTADGTLSAIAKSAVTGAQQIGPLGLAGDAQADLAVHGGVDKALHHYPRDHYDFWIERLGAHSLFDAPGAFGENISTFGLTETEACIGDRYRLGSALVEIAQGRQPCWKQAHRLGHPGVVKIMVKSGRSGWYYRVIERGQACAGDTLTLLDRPCPDWTVARVTAMIVGGSARDDGAAWRALAGLSVLAPGWRRHAQAHAG
jgi:MOSC domain-containing protein YiiM